MVKSLVPYFLVSLDRIALRWPFTVAYRQIALWKAHFLAEYLNNAPDCVAEDVVFFYPWALLWTLEDHSARFRLARPYLKSFYLGRLAAFLRSLRDRRLQGSVRL